ncbi:uncharacterized protein Dwil_GK10353 [Drosophila willistoni]|uniref:Kazal-like domain-containing protein n=1 Tax=Drosophila willistoni TaxID=7260 RepID=B4N3F7_DROWI|nr:uncharacterized protein LOC6645252 [Drosophila willistoni]EDW79162.1 uncharacterized protein Dwil_GK10353 [Drosophila willistoni]
MNQLLLLSVVCICVYASVQAKVMPMMKAHDLVINANGELVWADELTSVPDACDFHCTDQDLPVCAHNGQCLQMFTSSCTMSSYNCRHPQKRFDTVENWRCRENWAPMCSEAERKELKLQ